MPKQPARVNPRLEAVPMDLIDEPPVAARETMDEEKLADLIESIKDIGLIQPITLERTGDRYRIEAGHRRFIAHVALQATTIAANVYDAGTLNREAVKLHENLIREDLNSAEEAKYFSALLERDCGGDVDTLCQKVRRQRPYVESRLLLLRGDPEVLTALAGNRINVSVARILNEVKDQGYRRMYLDAAIKGGATARTVLEWKNQANGIAPIELPPQGEVTGAALRGPDISHTFTCVCCNSDEEHYDMELVYVHRTCKRRYLDRFLATLQRFEDAVVTGPVEGGL